MLCPHCNEQTPSTVARCQHCGEALDVTFDDVRASASREQERMERERPEVLAKQALRAALGLVIIALLARILLVPRVPERLVEPAVFIAVEEPPIAPLPLELPRPEIPQ